MKATEPIETASSFIRIDEEGILRLNIKQDARIGEDEVRRVYSIIQKITGGKKVLELMEGGSFYTFDEKAQKYAAKHGKDLFIASAIIIRSNAMRILFNFFNSFFDQLVPFRMFSNQEAALKWLRKYKKP